MYAVGRRQGGRLALVFARPNARTFPRLGVTATRKVGGAVDRNRAKRRVREVFRGWKSLRPGAGVDFVVNVRKAAVGADPRALRTELMELFDRAARDPA